MKNLTVASYSVAASAYLLLAIWLTLAGKTKGAASVAFRGWLLAFALVSVNGVIAASSRGSSLPILAHIHLALLAAAAALFWFFATALRRDLRERDVGFVVPAIVLMPLIWTVLVKRAETTAFGWRVVLNGPWAAVFFGTVFAYYVAAVVQLWGVLSALRRSGSHMGVKRIRLLFVSALIFVAAGLISPASQALEIPWSSAVLGFLNAVPAALMAYSFRLSDH